MRAGCRGMMSTRLATWRPLLRAALLAVSLSSACLIPAAAAQPDLVPPGWKHETASSNRRTIRFTSPDGRATLTMHDLGSAAASPAAAIQPRAGEQVTYQSRGQSWWVLSGFQGDDIFYRRAGYACGRRRIHVIELIYPREQKLKYDSLVTSMSLRLERYRNVCPKR